MPLFRAYQRWWSLVLFGALFLPLLMHPFLNEETPGAAEGRALSSWPKTPGDLELLLQYPQTLDAFLKDNFAGRTQLIESYHHLLYLLRSPSSRRVVHGEDGWMFLTDVRVLEQSTGRLVRKKGVAGYVTLSLKMEALLRKKGKQFFSIVLPNKHSIYPHYLPDWARTGPAYTEYDLFLELMSRHGLSTVDLRKVLQKAALKEPVYRRTDTHWNNLGAFLAYNAVVTAIGQEQWRIPRNEAIGGQIASRGGDLARFLGMQKRLTDRDYAIRLPDPAVGISERGKNRQRSYQLEGNGKGKSVLIIGDSFSRDLLRPYFAANASRLAWINHRGCRFDWSEIERLDPDIVLLMPVERGFSLCGKHKPINMPD